MDIYMNRTMGNSRILSASGSLPKQKKSDQEAVFVDNRGEARSHREFQKWVDNSHRTAQMAGLCSLISSPVDEAPVMQLVGPRNYADKFKKQKKIAVEWIKKQKLIGFDFAKSGEEEDALMGWHHQYPYSYLHELKNDLADSFANLKLGPIANRLGDPGHEIDISYTRALGDRAGYSPLGARLLEELRSEPVDGGASDLRPKNDINLTKIRSGDFHEDVFNDERNMEEYWSEWYLSKTVRRERLSESLINVYVRGAFGMEDGTVIKGIIDEVNKRLDSLECHYLTNSPVSTLPSLDEREKFKVDFKTEVTPDTGIPSSKLNRAGVLGESIPGIPDKTYADIVHGLLVEEKWVTRGSQGTPLNPKERFREVMRRNNDALIMSLLPGSDLRYFAEEVEERYKGLFYKSLSDMNVEPSQIEAFFGKVATDGILLEDKDNMVHLIEEFLSNSSAQKMQKKVKTREEIEPELPDSFVPDYLDSALDALVTICQKKHHNLVDVLSIADTIISANCSEEKIGEGCYIYDFEGSVVLSSAHLAECLKAQLKKRAPKKQFDDDLLEELAEKVIENLKNKSKDCSGYWQEYVEGEEVEKYVPVSVDEVYNKMFGTLKKQERVYISCKNHFLNPEIRIEYLPVIESALNQPGLGYNSPELLYPEPDGTKSEQMIRQSWYDGQFKAFLREFINSKGTQLYLLDFISRGILKK